MIYNVKLTFLEPYRLLEWHKKSYRNKLSFLRGFSFARWHRHKAKDKTTLKGRPYITGTLIRSAVLKAVEEILWMNDGVYNKTKCCNGEFNSHAKICWEKGLNVKRLRRRQTLTWSWDDKKYKCDKDNPCPYCLILGRYDGVTVNDNIDKSMIENTEKYHVKFFNFSLPVTKNSKNPPLLDLNKIACQRVVNRVDQKSGKAENFFNIWEVDHKENNIFYGQIYVSDKAGKIVESLLEDAFKIVDHVSGALIILEPLPDNSKINKEEYIYKNGEEADEYEQSNKKSKSPFDTDIEKLAEEISDAFIKNGTLVHLRLFSDVFRELRRYNYNDIILPKGHIDRLEEPKNHYIWDMEVENSKMRTWIFEKYNKLSNKKKYKGEVRWNIFCEKMGNALYIQAKQKSPESFESQRPLGASISLHKSKDIDQNIRAEKKLEKLIIYEFLIIGELKAMTPFFFGWNKLNDSSDQTSMLLLTTSDGHLRLPRSVLRGILRRDLAIAFGSGCKVELGNDVPCSCPVCNLLRNITLKDSVSKYKKPPQIRHRIRINQSSGTVSKGALFDMEVGPKGVLFPFELRLRTNENKLPKELEDVLGWWHQEMAFLSGGAGTGKGRFYLNKLEYSCWNLNDLTDYAICYGGRKKLPKERNNLKISSEKAYPWHVLSELNINVNSPFLTKDPIETMFYKNKNDDSAVDAICYRSIKAEENNDTKIDFLLKGESFRGILRTAVGRRNKDKNKQNLLAIEHEDCECLLCKLFGNEHEAGKLRVEDLIIQGEVKEKLLDRVAIDRFTAGAIDKHKFDNMPVTGTPSNPIKFKGKIWIHKDITNKEKKVLKEALDDIKKGLYPLGALGNIGYGWVDYNPGIDENTTPKITLPIKLSKKKFKIDEQKVYWPHYFFPFTKAKVKRTNTPPSHITINKELYSGKIICTIKTLTPLIIPDTGEVKNDTKYNWFKINDQLCIPGSEIKGMISSVFEALTNSCMRIFDEKKRLSWRMKAEKLDQWKPGMITRDKENNLFIEEMEEIRLPLYDKPKLIDKINSEGAKGYYDGKKYSNQERKRAKQATPVDQLINSNSENNRDLLKKDDELKNGKKKIQWYKCAPHGMDKLALKDKPEKNCKQDKSGFINGYVYFTGPNKIEVKNIENNKDQTIPEDPLEIIHNEVNLDIIRVNSRKKGRPDIIDPRKRAVPAYEVEKDDKKYKMTKRCEKVFIPKDKQKKLPVSYLVEDKFKQLCEEYKKNVQSIPKVFHTRLPENGILKNGDLVYFCKDEKNNNGKVTVTVTDIIPVKISRRVDNKVLGEKLRDDLRPCVREILDKETEDNINKNGLKELYQHHPEGLCPACSIFGTTFYKGRVAFGFAFPKNDKIEMLESGKHITLPLLERPRPSWSMPEPKNDIPGRKFYIHHQGWKQVVENKVKETINNKSIQAVQKNQEFTFEVRYENLKSWELGLLLYCLHLEPHMAHKLGTGKALGFGSIKIEINDIVSFEKECDKEKIAQEAEKKLKEFWDPDISGLEILFKMLFYNSNEKIMVKYPALRKKDDKTDDKKDGYEELKDEKREFAPNKRRKKITDAWSWWC